jgi:hypothetical protein
MALLIQSGTLDVSQTAEALRRTFDRRGTHPIPAALEPPPSTGIRHLKGWLMSASSTIL